MPATPDTKKFMQDLAGIVREHVGAAVRPINERLNALESRPLPQDGKSVSVDDVKPVILQIVKTEADVSTDTLRETLLKAFEPITSRLEALEKIEIPEVIHGKSVTVDDVKPMVSELVKEAVAAQPVKEPIGISGAIIDREGALVLTFTDGSHKSLGVVVGKDADSAPLYSLIKDELAKIPVPKDGVDGFSLEDFSADVSEDGKTVTLKFERGNLKKSIELIFPVVVYKEIWTEREYEKGDAVTYGGSLWIARKETNGKPGISSDWKLSVKRGRDGKQA